MQASFMKKLLLLSTRSILLILVMFVGASANHFSRRWKSVVRFSPTQIHSKSKTRFSDVGSRRRHQHCWGNNSAFVTCSARPKISPKVSHHRRLRPISFDHSQLIHMSTVAHTEYCHSILTNELNDSQKEATLRPRYSITRVVAGPGAGKTKVLTCRIAHLLLDNNDDGGDDGYRRSKREGILAVTFTKKAAMEMETRLTTLLSSVVSESQSDDEMAPNGIYTGDDPILQEGEFVQYGNADPSDGNNVDDAYARSLLRQATVGTFHSVCSKILRKFGKELGELPSVRQCVGVRNLSGAQLTQEGVQTQSSGEDGQSMLSSALTLDGSFNILDQSDQLRLLKDVLKEHNIQLSSAAASSSGGKGNDIRPITVLNAISLLNTEEALSSTQRGTKKEDESDKMSRKVRQIATQIRAPFQRAKYSQNSVDFDDLILLSRELLLHHPEIREVLHSRWRHILVDEFQDTSQVQLELVRLLTTNSLFVVGDGDQSIYSWRGASPESMTSDFELAFHDRKHGWEGLLKQDISLKQYLGRICRSSATAELPESATLEVESVYLMENYRSTTNIVRAAQRIISASSNNGESTQDSMRRDMKPMRGNGPSPRVLACKDGKSEANFVVNTINSMVESGDLTPSSTVAMIYRTNAQSRLLEEACVEQNLRYVVRGSSGTFYKRAEIQDCMSFLKIMYNARDRSAWARAVKAPSRGIGEASLDEFFSYCDAVTAAYLETQGNEKSPPTPLDVLMSLVPRGDGGTNEMVGIPPNSCMSTRSLNRFIPFALSMKSLKDKAHEQNVSEFLMSLIEDLNLRSHFDAISKTREEYEDRVGNVMELVRAANRYDDHGPCLVISEKELESPLGNFLDDVALIADIAPDDEADDGNGRIVANLMTIHSSKGMEFDAVFLVGNEEGTFPTQKAISEGEGSVELSEERRLCYVAMTRAKTHLVLTWRREVSYFAGSSFKTKDADRSRFLRILVSKRDNGKKPKASSFTGVGQSSQAQMKNQRKNLNSFTKRQLHSEANKYLSTDPTTGLRPKQRQVRNQPPDKDLPSVTKQGLHSDANQYVAIDPITGLRPRQRQASNQPPPSRDFKAVTKRELHSEASNYPAVNSRAAPKKSWDDWEPSSQKKPIKEIPKIRPSVPNTGVNKQANAKSSSPNFTSPQATRRSYPEQLQRNNGHREITSPPRRREPERPPNGMRNNEAIPSPKRAQRKPRNDIIGELPPDMDSTMFFPVGSAVKHKFHGRGIVQDPPQTTDYAEFAEKLLVRVKFSDGGGEWDVPMESVVHTFDG